MEKIEINGITVFIEEAERHLQINDIGEADLKAVWPVLQTRYPGFELDLCFRDMDEPADLLAEMGAAILDDCLKMVVKPDEFLPTNSTAALLAKADFAKFSAIHDKTHDPDFYWNSRRILDKWDIWRIFVMPEMAGYTMLDLRNINQSEIFCVHADNQPARAELLTAAINCAYEAGRDYVQYMVDRDNEAEYAAARAVGFQEVGFYRGYQVKSI